MTLRSAEPGLLQRLADVAVEVGLRHVAAHVGHAVGELAPDILVDVIDVELRRGVADKTFEHVVQVLSPGGRVAVGEIDADQLDRPRQALLAPKIVDRRNHEPLREVPEGAEDDDRAGLGALEGLTGVGNRI